MMSHWFYFQEFPWKISEGFSQVHKIPCFYPEHNYFFLTCVSALFSLSVFFFFLAFLSCTAVLYFDNSRSCTKTYFERWAQYLYADLRLNSWGLVAENPINNKSSVLFCAGLRCAALCHIDNVPDVQIHWSFCHWFSHICHRHVFFVHNPYGHLFAKFPYGGLYQIFLKR